MTFKNVRKLLYLCLKKKEGNIIVRITEARKNYL